MFTQAAVTAARRFNRKKGWVLSSHIAMSMMLALFPFVLFTVAMAGAFADISAQAMDRQEVIELVFGAWPQGVAEPIVVEINAVLQTSGVKLATFGAVLAMYFASNGVDAIRLALVSAYHEADQRPFWHSRLICISLVIAGGAALLLAAIFEVLLPFYARNLADFLPMVQLGAGWENGLNGVLVTVLPLAAVLMCHLVLPKHRYTVAQIAPGVLLTFVLWWAAGLGFAIYIGRFAQYSATYAGLAGAMAALIFLYLNAAILIFGAEYNGALMDLRANNKT